MLLTTKYAIRKVGHSLHAGTARIINLVSGGQRWPDEPHYYVVVDDVEQSTHHVRCSDRPSWIKYLKSKY